MRFVGEAITDVGTTKKVNQDSLALISSKTFLGEVIMAIVADGMGGFKEGELASTTIVKRFEEWFTSEFESLLFSGISENVIKETWLEKMTEVNLLLYNYGKTNDLKVGTTAVVMLGIGDTYYVMNIGDSRLYEINDTACQITEDHTFVNREVKAGRLKTEEAINHPKSHVLTSCLGVTDSFAYDFYSGELLPDIYYMLCSDGFRNKISELEIGEAFHGVMNYDANEIKNCEKRLIDVCKNRGEKDNISVVAFGLAPSTASERIITDEPITEAIDDNINIIYTHSENTL